MTDFSSVFALFVRRPVTTAVMSLLLLLFGVVALQVLSVRETPQVQAPVVTVSTVWFGADPSLMESDVTEVLERQINGIEGIRTITSTSSEQQSTVTVEFVLGRNLEEAANDVRSRVARARRELPPDVEEPVVEKAEADAQPVVFLRIDSEGKDLVALTEIADTLVRERIQTVAGVSQVQIYGEQVPAIRIDLEPGRLASRKLTIGDLETALAANQVALPAGRVEGLNSEMSVRLVGDLRTVEQFRDMVVAKRGSALIRLGDVADVRAGAENERSAARSDGKPTVTVAVMPQSNANIIEISNEISRRLPRVREDLPEGVGIVIGYDRSQAVRASIEEVVETLVIAFGLVVVVIFAFLRDWRSTLVPALAIPVSLLGTLPFLYFAGFSINVFTLFGLVLAIGLVVDDAIVVLENIVRHIEAGMDPYEASIKGTQEIAFAVIATTLVLVCVFVPVVLTGGTSGRLFVEFGSTVAVSVLISAFVALTLTPMLCARLLVRHEGKGGIVYRTGGAALNGVTWGFERTLGVGMRFPILPLLAALVTLVIGGLSYTQVPREFFPIEDRNLLLVRTLAPEGTSFAYMNARMAELEPALMAAVPERVSVLSRVALGTGNSVGSSNTGMFVLPLVPKSERARSQAQILGAVRKETGAVTAFLAIPIQPATVGRGFGSQFQFVLQNADFNALAAELPKFTQRLREIPGLSAVNADLKLERPELLLVPDRDKAALVDVPIRELARTLQVLAGGREVAQFKKGTRQYPVIASLAPEFRASPQDLLDVSIRTRTGQMVTLGNLLASSEGSAAASRFHYERSPSATISANLDGITLGEALERAQKMADDTLPDGFRTAYAGESKEFSESNAALSVVLLLAVALVYLVLAAQFDSFVDPLAILIGAPLALAAAVFSLWVTGTTLSFFSQVGLILLVGLITKNGILIVEVGRQMREHDPSLDPWVAADRAARLRFRPILMTSVATIGGALPIALGFTSASRAPLGVVVVGGMLLSTGLSLYVTPVAWAMVSRLAGRRVVAPVAALVPLALLALWSADARAEDLTLADALREAMTGSPTIAGAAADADVAAASVGLARSGVLPSVVASADAYEGADARFGAPSPALTVITGVRATAPLLDASGWKSLEAAKSVRLAGDATRDAVGEAVLADVAVRYVALQRADQAVLVAAAAIARSERLLAIAEDRVAVELGTPLDAARARYRLAQDRQLALAARTDRTEARVRLAEALGRPLDADVSAVPATPLVPLAELPASAATIGSHPSVMAVTEGLAATTSVRQAAAVAWVPSVDVYATGGVFYRSSLDAPAPTWSVGVTTSAPLFLGTARASELDRARASERGAEADRDVVWRSVEAARAVAAADLQDRADGVYLADDGRALAAAELVLAEDRFATGASDNAAVVDAQARLAEAERTLVDAVASFNLAVVAWYRAEGTLESLAR